MWLPVWSGEVIHAYDEYNPALAELYKSHLMLGEIMENDDPNFELDISFGEFDKMVKESVMFVQKSEINAMTKSLNYLNTLNSEEFKGKNGVNFLEVIKSDVSSHITSVHENSYMGTDYDSRELWNNIHGKEISQND